MVTKRLFGTPSYGTPAVCKFAIKMLAIIAAIITVATLQSLYYITHIYIPEPHILSLSRPSLNLNVAVSLSVTITVPILVTSIVQFSINKKWKMVSL